MKKIFVTVAKFLENGGDLKSGTILYANDKFTTIGRFESFNSNGNLCVLGYTMLKSYTFVKIDCTPHYV